MSVRSMPGRLRARALAEANLRKLERPVLRAVRRRLASEHVSLPVPDLEAAYNQGWQGVYEMVAQGGEIENLTGLLVTITWRRAIDAYRQRNEALHIDKPLPDQVEEVDLAERVDDQQKINHLIKRLVERLNPKERNAVTLCLLHGYSRPEAATRLGITEPAIQKIMDSATRKIAGVVAGIDARGCGGDEWARALRAFALGLTPEDSPDYPRIAQHIEECDTCKRYVMGLRGLAAALPPLAAFGHGIIGLAHVRKVFAPAHAVGGAAQTTGAIAGGSAATAGTGSGLAGLLGGGAAKIAVVAAGLAAAAAVTVQVTTHHPAHHAPPAVKRALLRQAAGASSLAASPAPTHLVSHRAYKRRRHKAPTHRQTPVTPQAIVTNREGIERPPTGTPTAESSEAPAAATTSTRSTPSHHEESANGEFSFEQEPKK